MLKVTGMLKEGHISRDIIPLPKRIITPVPFLGSGVTKKHTANGPGRQFIWCVEIVHKGCTPKNAQWKGKMVLPRVKKRVRRAVSQNRGGYPINQKGSSENSIPPELFWHFHMGQQGAGDVK
jgi:hypothetical protein